MLYIFYWNITFFEENGLENEIPTIVPWGLSILRKVFNIFSFFLKCSLTLGFDLGIRKVVPGYQRHVCVFGLVTFIAVCHRDELYETCKKLNFNPGYYISVEGQHIIFKTVVTVFIYLYAQKYLQNKSFCSRFPNWPFHE